MPIRPALALALTALCVACGGPFASVPEPNFSHLAHLTRPVTVTHQDALAVWIYADAPSYQLVSAPGEGFTCVDDVARAAVALLLHAERTGDPEAERMASGALRFVLGMQTDDGELYNFLNDDLTINRDGKTSYASHGWWAARALWAMATGLGYFQARDPALARDLEVGLRRLLPHYQAYVVRRGEHSEVEGVRVPAWLVEDASDITSIVVLGLLEWNRVRPSDDLETAIIAFCDGLTELQVTDPASMLYGAHLSTTKRPRFWHHWGSRQTMALARAARLLPNAPGASAWLGSARLEADAFFARLLRTHVPEEIEGDRIKPYPQIAYGLNTLVLGALELWRATEEPRYRDMALEAFAWYLGRNPPGVTMYDEATGRCFDGIVSAEEVNRNSGAESTIEALLAIEELRR
jgi:hypothetical protein